MSDLAPFVAAALRDKVVNDIQEENKKLMELYANRAKQVRVTGAHGTPVYAMGSIDDATVEVVDEEIKQRVVKLFNIESSPRPNSIVDLRNAELHVGDKRVDVFRSAEQSGARAVQEEGVSYAQLQCRFWEDQFTYINVTFQIGPFTAQEAATQERHCNSGTSHRPVVTRLASVPDARFVKVELAEPNFVTDP